MSTIFPVLLSSENLVEYPPQFVDIALVFLALIITMEKTEVRKIFFFPLESALIFLSRGLVYNIKEEMKMIISNLTLPKQWCFFLLIVICMSIFFLSLS